MPFSRQVAQPARGVHRQMSGGVICGVFRKHAWDEWWRRFKKAKWQLIMAGFDCSHCLLALLLGERGFKCLAAPFKHLKL